MNSFDKVQKINGTNYLFFIELPLPYRHLDPRLWNSERDLRYALLQHTLYAAGPVSYRDKVTQV